MKFTGIFSLPNTTINTVVYTLHVRATYIKRHLLVMFLGLFQDINHIDTIQSKLSDLLDLAE